MTRRDPEDDPIANFMMELGPTGVAIFMAAATLAGFCVAYHLVSLLPWSVNK